MKLSSLDNKKSSRSNFRARKMKKKKKHSEKIYYIFEDGTF